MSDMQSILSALGAMSQKQREEFLSVALSRQPIEVLDAILRKLDMKELPVNSKVGLVFAMGLSPVAHAFRGGPARELRWVIPQIPTHLRPLVYATSRLINEFQETLVCLQNGRGDFVKAFTLLNPENMLGMVNRFTDEMQVYTEQLRDANGRFNRAGPARQRRTSGTRPSREEAVVSEPVTGETTTPEGQAESAVGSKPRRTSSRSKAKAQDTPRETAPEAGEVLAEDVSVTEVVMEKSADDTQATAQATDASVTADSPPAEGDMDAFGFDVFAVAADSEGQTLRNAKDGE